MKKLLNIGKKKILLKRCEVIADNLNSKRDS